LCEFCGQLSERILGGTLTLGPRVDLWSSAHSRDISTEKQLAALLVDRSTRERLAQASDSQIETALAHVGTGSTQNDDRTVSRVMNRATSDRRGGTQSDSRLRDQVGPEPHDSMRSIRGDGHLHADEGTLISRKRIEDLRFYVE
jgi:hypothetical protein